MLAWSEGTDNGRQKTRNHGYDVIVGGGYLQLLRSPSLETCHPRQNSNQRAPDATSFFPDWWDACKQLGLKGFSPKSGTLYGVKGVALYL